MNEIGAGFIAQSRYYLAKDYLPKIERSLALLKEEQIWWRSNQQSNSVGNLVLHLTGNVRQWIVVGLGGATDTRDRDAEFAQRDAIPRDEIIGRLKQTLHEADETLAALDPEKLLEKVRIQGLEVSVLEAILHVVEHFSMHVGQIVYITKLLTAHDLHFYDL